MCLLLLRKSGVVRPAQRRNRLRLVPCFHCIHSRENDQLLQFANGFVFDEIRTVLRREAILPGQSATANESKQDYLAHAPAFAFSIFSSSSYFDRADKSLSTCLLVSSGQCAVTLTVMVEPDAFFTAPCELQSCSNAIEKWLINVGAQYDGRTKSRQGKDQTNTICPRLLLEP